MRKDEPSRINRSLFSLSGYIGYFCFTFFVCACSLALYVSTMETKKNGEWHYVALSVIGNIVFLSFLATIFDGARRKLTWERPVRRIVKATEQIAVGDFSVRIQPVNALGKQNELDVIIEDFNKMAAELASIEMMQNDFIANVSHEIKTPLAIIQNYAMVLKKENLTEEEREEYLETIVEASKKLTSLVTNILKLNRLENQEIASEKMSFHLSEQIRCCVLGLEDIWEKKQITCSVEGEDIWITGDPTLWEIVWTNLLSNAIKFTEEKGSITIKIAETEGMVRVSVSDTGCGMDEKTSSHIFNKFYQGDSSHAKEGNGLGLAMVKRVVDMMKADIHIDSKLGVGTTITICILT